MRNLYLVISTNENVQFTIIRNQYAIANFKNFIILEGHKERNVSAIRFMHSTTLFVGLDRVGHVTQKPYKFARHVTQRI